MDVKIMTRFLLCAYLIASLSVLLTNSASLDSRQRFRRQSDESIACPEGTKACKDDNKMCAVHCNGNFECADGSDEIDCVTSAPSSSLSPSTNASAFVSSVTTSEHVTADVSTASLPIIVNASSKSLPAIINASIDSEVTEIIAIAESTESIGVEMERANVPGETTEDNTEGTTTGDDAVTTAAGAAAETATAVLADGTTIVLPLGTTATLVAEPVTQTAILGDGTTIVLPLGTTSTVTAEVATETVEPAATGIVVDGTTIGAATVEAVTTEVPVTEEVTATQFVADVEASTVVLVDNGTNIFTSIQPGNGDAEDETTTANDVEVTTSDVEGTTGADVEGTTGSDVEGTTGDVEGTTGDVEGTTGDVEGTTGTDVEGTTGTDAEVTTGTDAVTDEITTVEAVTIDTNGTTSVDNETLTTVFPDVTTASLNETDSGNETWSTTIDTLDDGNTTQSNATEEITTPELSPTTVGGRVELRVVVSPEILQVQYGQTYELTCGVYGADASTTIYWIQEEPERRYALTEPAEANDKQITASQVSLRSRIRIDDRSKIGKYTCMAQDAAGNSGSAILTMQEGYSDYVPVPQGPVGPSYGPSGVPGYLRIVAPDMAEGDYVEIQCEGASPEDEGRIQWFFNNRLLTDEEPLFPRGKTLYIRPVSRPYLGNYRCSVPGSSYADANSVITFGPSQDIPPTPAVPYVQPTGRCNIDEATCRNGRCIPRAYLYDGKDDCGDNSDEGAASIGVDGCQPNEIRCSNPDRGRKCVQKFWMCDGDRDCDDGSDEATNYCELLPRQRNCKPSEFQCGGLNATTPNAVCIPRSFQCDGYTDCPDRSDEVGCVKPTVVSAPQRQIQINVGQTLTIQCTARGSPSPYINWRLNWGHVCGDGSDNGRCIMAQSIDSNDPTLVTGTLTVRNVNTPDGGAYSCEALNNQGFVFAVPDAIVEVNYGGPAPPSQTVPCNCNGHSSFCAPNGQCLNCQHNTAGYNCEFCAPGYEGDARRGTPYDCQPARSPSGAGNCDPSGTYTERDGRCVCKYNVQGDRCDQCKPSHFYLNPTTPNGCLPCFCSGVSTDCTSTAWRRQAVPIPLNNWNAVPKNFATDRYEAGDRIQQRDGGRELALDQSSLGRPANEVLYWKAPKAALGDFVTLYDGNIDVYFTNDGNNREAPSDDEFIWLRGNNIDLVHKLPQNQRFAANTNATYSVAVNERTFTRKDGTYIDRENILMALSDLDTLLVKINPIGGRKTAVLRGVTLNVAAGNGYADAAPTVESCRCPANYTGTSCEKCAPGYGRPHPLVGIYLGQCWSCRSLCNERSDQCDSETGRCYDCQGNSEGERCERCRPGYVLDAQRNQCVPQDQYVQDPYGQGTGSGIYVDQQPYNTGSVAPLRIVLDGNQVEQRIPVQVLNTQSQSVVWGRTDGSPFPANVVQEGNDLVFRNPSSEQAGNYICTITHSGGAVDHINVYVDYRPGRTPTIGTPVFSPASPLTLIEGQSQLIQPQGGYYQVQWRRENGQPFPSGIYQNGNALEVTNARPDQSGTYECELRGPAGTQRVAYQIYVTPGRVSAATGGGPPKISIEPKTINLTEGQRMIVQYSISSPDPINVEWKKSNGRGYEPLPSYFQSNNTQLILNRAPPEASGLYQVAVSNQHGTDYQELRINVKPRRPRGRGQQSGAPQIRFQQTEYDIAYGQTIEITPNLYGATGATITWTKDGSSNLPDGVTDLGNGVLRVDGRSNDIQGQYVLGVSSGYGQASSPIFIRWISTNQNTNYGQDDSRGYYGGYDQQQQNTYIEVTVEPNEVTLKRGEKKNLTCVVKGAEQYTITWSKYAHDTSLPSYARQEGNSLILAPTDDSQAEQMYLQCSVNVPGLSQPYTGYAPVTVLGNNETLKKKKKRRSL